MKHKVSLFVKPKETTQRVKRNPGQNWGCISAQKHLDLARSAYIEKCKKETESTKKRDGGTSISGNTSRPFRPYLRGTKSALPFQRFSEAILRVPLNREPSVMEVRKITSTGCATWAFFRIYLLLRWTGRRDTNKLLV